MDDHLINEIKRQFSNNEWKQFIKSIKITNLRGWNEQKVEFRFPVVAIVGANGIGKSTFLKSTVCAYENKCGKTFYPSKMFIRTQWDNHSVDGALINYTILQGEETKELKWKKTKDWGFTPKQGKPKRNVFFLDISRTLPLDATAGYAKIAKTANEEIGNEIALTEETLRDLSYVLGKKYTNGRFVTTNIDSIKEVGILAVDNGNDISQFHQGAGEDAILDLFKLLQTIPQQSLLVIDEVEASLHPQAQRRLIRHLLKIAKSKKIQVILSTHSPFVLEELPDIARVMMIQLSERKDVVYNVSSDFALSTIDDVAHHELCVFVEDDEAVQLLFEILKQDTERFDMISRRIIAKAVGSYSVVSTLDELAKNHKLPYKSLAIIDGDKKTEAPNCLSFPGDIAPEQLIFQDLKNNGWNNLDDRFGIGAGSLYKIFEDAMLNPDHHKWTTEIGDKIKKSKDYVWLILAETWCKNHLDENKKSEILTSILTILNS